jgi:hypothetical protein
MSVVYLFEQAGLETRRKVWNKARPLKKNGQKYNESIWRIDVFGQVIRYDDYGETGSTYGWGVVCVKGDEQGGEDSADNLQALHWRNIHE